MERNQNEGAGMSNSFSAAWIVYKILPSKGAKFWSRLYWRNVRHSCDSLDFFSSCDECSQLSSVFLSPSFQTIATDVETLNNARPENWLITFQRLIHHLSGKLFLEICGKAKYFLQTQFWKELYKYMRKQTQMNGIFCWNSKVLNIYFLTKWIATEKTLFRAMAALVYVLSCIHHRCCVYKQWLQIYLSVVWRLFGAYRNIWQLRFMFSFVFCVFMWLLSSARFDGLIDSMGLSFNLHAQPLWFYRWQYLKLRLPREMGSWFTIIDINTITVSFHTVVRWLIVANSLVHNSQENYFWRNRFIYGHK